MFKLLTIPVLLFLLCGCSTITEAVMGTEYQRVAQDVESWVLEKVPYTDTEKCGHRALVAKCMLEEMSYKVKYTSQKVEDSCYHAYLEWEKNGKKGNLFKL